MSRGVFISYRHSDAKEYAKHIYSSVAKQFPNIALFLDVESIEPGSNFDLTIRRTMARCGVLIALIGPEWLKATDAAGRSRLRDPKDYVRLEILEALRRRIPIVPVLLPGAAMPSESALPRELRPLAYRNA